jgi:hypothetical protein
MLCVAGVSVDDDLPVRSVNSDGAAMVAALIAEGLEQRGDGRFRAAARMLTPPATSRSSCRAAQTSCADILIFEGLGLGLGLGSKLSVLAATRECRCLWPWLYMHHLLGRVRQEVNSGSSA